MNYAVWNTLHDGSIESVHGEIPGDVTVSVDIAYLCQKLPTSAKALEIHLRKCMRFEYQPFGGDPVTSLPELGIHGIEILSAKQEDSLITVICVAGYLKLAYEAVEIRLLEGSMISQADLESAAASYWAEWNQKNARK